MNGLALKVDKWYSHDFGEVQIFYLDMESFILELIILSFQSLLSSTGFTGVLLQRYRIANFRL